MVLHGVQAVPVAQAQSSSSHTVPHQAVFALNEPSGRLYAVGGAAPSTVHTWDMSQERCTHQVRHPLLVGKDVREAMAAVIKTWA